MISFLVIGGLNMDLLGVPARSGVARDSQAGSILMRPGGVGRNIAAALVGLGAQAQLLSVIGNDEFARILQAACRKDGIGLDFSLRANASSCMYMAIHDAQGDMLCAINDMAAASLLDEEMVIRLMPQAGYACCVLDANLSPGALRAAVNIARVPLVADPVSCAKADALRPILPRLKALKPNLLEAQHLSGKTDPSAAAQALLEMGVSQVYISLGADGVYFADHQHCGHLPVASRIGTPATGAGDAMTAGVALGVAQALPALEVARLGLDAASRHLMNAQTQEVEE